MLELCDGVDLLVHDAQHTAPEFEHKRHWGHCTNDYALHVAATLLRECKRGAVLRLAARLFPFNQQMLHIVDAKVIENGILRLSCPPLARMLHSLIDGLRKNLFHISANKPAGSGAIGIGDALVERRFGEAPRAGLLKQRSHCLQIQRIWRYRNDVIHQ